VGEHFYTYPTVIELHAEPNPAPRPGGGDVDRRSWQAVPDRAHSAQLQPQIRRPARADR